MKRLPQRVIFTLFFSALILCACSSRVASPQPVHPSTTAAASTLEATKVPDLILTVGTPHIDQPPDGVVTDVPTDPQACGYQWAYQDLPELSSNFQQSIQALQPEAQASAFAFGENCLRADGSVGRFIAMETDFNITLQVDSITDEARLGEWIVKVMQVIDNIPAEQIVGPRPGRVSIFFQASGDQEGVNFYIDQYQALPSGLSTAEIYQALQTPQ